MAKKEETKEVKVEKYFINPVVQEEGYYAKVDGVHFQIIPASYVNTSRGKKLVAPLEVKQGKGEGNQDNFHNVEWFVQSNEPYLTGLSDEQSRVLLIAKVIELSKEQSESYRKKK